MKDYFPTVVQVIPLDNFHVQVFFDDGKIVDYDVTGDIDKEMLEAETEEQREFYQVVGDFLLQKKQREEIGKQYDG